MKSIEIIACGGTIEKQYQPEDGTMGFAATTQIPQWLITARLHPECRVRVRTAHLIDSLDATDQHRQQLAGMVAASSADAVVVVHGTDTLTLSAAAVDAERQPGQTVVFVGAMIPAQVPNSDAMFNLGFALAACQLAEAGTHIAMGGRLLNHQKAFKNRGLARFDEMA